MKIEKLEERISDIEYRVSLDEHALENAKYNYKYADLLNYTPQQITKFKEKIDIYTRKLDTDTHTLCALKECYETNKNYDEALEPSYLFKCTLPFEKVDPITLYQTTITVKDNVASLFANGVSYKDIIPCIENSDVINIESKFASKLPLLSSFDDNVKVEYLEGGVNTISCSNSPVIAKLNNKNTIGIIASNQIPVCYPYGEATYKDFDGNEYTPETPKLGDICDIQKKSFEKESKYYKMVDLEDTVRFKMQSTYDKMTNMLNKI